VRFRSGTEVAQFAMFENALFTSAMLIFGRGA
jgi:hypothetical protein